MAEKKTVTAKKTTKKTAAAKKAKPTDGTAAKSVAAKKVTKPVAVPSSPRTLPQLPWALPVRTFGRWALVIVIGFALVSSWLANTLIEARQEDLVAEIKERTAVQASGRAAVVNEWLQGHMELANNLTNSDLMRLFATEMTLNRMAAGEVGDPNRDMRTALVAQIPYMQQTVKELVNRHNLVAAYVIDQSGQAFLASEPMESFSLEQQRGVSNVFASRQPQVLGMHIRKDMLTLDILKPIFTLEDEDQNPPVSAALLMSIPVEEKLGGLLNLGPLGQKGERVTLLQQNGLEDLVLVRGGSLSQLEPTESELLEKTSKNLTPVSSPVDGSSVFATLIPVNGSPFRILHEYQSRHALAFIDLYSKGVYGMVSLACLALITTALMIIAHLLAQRNRNRVQHQGKTMEALVRAVEIRDPYLSGHYNRVARLATNLGGDLGLPVRQRSTLFYAAQMSGIGKMFISQATLTKKGKLTAAERKEVEAHVDHALTVLKDIEFDLPVTDVIGQMYERMDGTGYPNKLKGQEVNVLSRVLAVCDTYCAMTRPRSYRDGMKDEEALRYLKDNLNLFDEKAVSALEKRLMSS
ncbi:MAG: hypothetical protein OXR68_05720 [Alphaproteobacteria bacterium]|nr:hypothetical protein [Alphaproteobacteria bacterium]MDD9920103.1 hypothetical protein [Alphaproteobacteria bacterium]